MITTTYAVVPTPSPIPPSIELEGKRAFARPAVREVGRRLEAAIARPGVYARYLIALHQIIRASVPLMATAVSICRQRAATDAIASQMVSYLERHIEEETSHDEWLLDDLEVIGVPRDHVLGEIPSEHACDLVGSQYYLILHHHPVGLLGYIALMESDPPRNAGIDAWQARTGLPPAAFRTLRVHADADPHHNAELDAFIDSLPLSAEQRTLLGVSSLRAAHHLVQALNEIVEHAHRR
jgi:hypothetical protein